MFRASLGGGLLLLVLVVAELGRMFEDLVDEPELERLLRAHELVPVQRGLDQVVGSPFKGIVSRDE
jgi:hypothetical protein